MELKKRLRVIIFLFFFPYHLNRFFRAFIGADTTPFTEGKIDIQIIINRPVRTVHCAKPAGIAFFPVNYRFKHPP
jgi:hypothetical protein